jgi:hypothetical protein
MQIAAELTRESIKISKQALTAGQRAFLYSAGWRWQLQSDGKTKFYRFIVSWENTGNTPTRNARISLDCPGSPTHVADPQTLARPEMGMVATRTFGPKQAFDTGGICDWEISYVTKLAKGDFRIYLLARATYDDLFGDKHVTEFCRELIGLEGPLGVDIGHGATFFDSPCETHNCADQECGNVTPIPESDRDSHPVPGVKPP